MAALSPHTFTPGELQVINQVQIHQQVLYLSNVLNANGKNIDGKYRHLRESSVQWSFFHWPTVFLGGRDLNIWQQALDVIALLQQIQDMLGKWTSTMQKRWAWHLDCTTNRHTTADGVDRNGIPTGAQPNH